MVRNINRVYQDQFRLRRRRRFAIRVGLVILVVLAIIGGVIYGLFWSGVFAVNQIVLDNTSAAPNDQVETVVNNYLNQKHWLIAHRQNFLLVNSAEITRQLVATFPAAKEISVSRKLLHRLAVTLHKREPIGVWCYNNTNCFQFDDTSWALARAEQPTGFKVEDYQHSALAEPGVAVTNIALFNFIMAIDAKLPSLGISSSQIILPAADRFQVIFVTSEGWRLLTASDQAADQQLRALAAVLENKITPEQRPTLQYIDIQLPNRVYFK